MVCYPRGNDTLEMVCYPLEMVCYPRGNDTLEMVCYPLEMVCYPRGNVNFSELSNPCISQLFVSIQHYLSSHIGFAYTVLLYSDFPIC
jgi:hypothetical protein